MLRHRADVISHNETMTASNQGQQLLFEQAVDEGLLTGLELQDLAFRYRDLATYAPACAVAACLHEEEEGCAVRDAAGAGNVHPDRYESYLRALAELRDERRYAHG